MGEKRDIERTPEALARFVELESLRVGFKEAKDQIRDLTKREKKLREELKEAVDLAHFLLANQFPVFPCFIQGPPNLFLAGRRLLLKHGRIK